MTKNTTPMDVYKLKDDLRLFYVTARSFPYGMAAAFATLENRLRVCRGRVFLGLVDTDAQGTTTYRAAATQAYPGERPRHPIGTFVLPRGEYWGKTIPPGHDRQTHTAPAFAALRGNPRVDAGFPAVEWYGDCGTITCMLRMDPAPSETPDTAHTGTNHHKTNALC